MYIDVSLAAQILNHTDSLFFVDLSKPPTDEIEDDRPMSMRDALVFLEYASFMKSESAPNAKGGEGTLKIIYTMKPVLKAIPKNGWI